MSVHKQQDGQCPSTNNRTDSVCLQTKGRAHAARGIHDLNRHVIVQKPLCHQYSDLSSLSLPRRDARMCDVSHRSPLPRLKFLGRCFLFFCLFCFCLFFIPLLCLLLSFSTHSCGSFYFVVFLLTAPFADFFFPENSSVFFINRQALSFFFLSGSC